MNRLPTTELTNAISHQARRRILRALDAQSRPCSLPELAREAGLPLPSANYHLRVLQGCGAMRSTPEENAAGTATYESAVSEQQWLSARLAATEAEDEGRV